MPSLKRNTNVQASVGLEHKTGQVVLRLMNSQLLTWRIPISLIMFGAVFSFLVAHDDAAASAQVQAMQQDAGRKTVVAQKTAASTKYADAKDAAKKQDYLHQIAIGDAYLEKKHYDLAIAAYDKAAEINPEGVQAKLHRADAVRLKSQYDMGLARSNRTIELRPDDPMGYVLRGKAYVGHGRYELATADFNRAIQLNPRNAEAYENRAHSHFKTGHYDQAISDFSKAIQLESSPTQ